MALDMAPVGFVLGIREVLFKVKKEFLLHILESYLKK